MVRRWWSALICAVVLVLGAAAASAQDVDAGAPEADASGVSQLRVAGGESGVWIAQAEGEAFRLSLAEVSEEQIGLRRVVGMGELPHLMIPSGSGPLLFFGARGEGPERIYPVRRGRFEDRAGLAITGSLEATTPLQTTHELVSGETAGGRVFVLLSPTDPDSGVFLLTLEGHRWMRVRLPVELSDASLEPDKLRLLDAGGELGVLVDGPSEDLSVLWTLGAIEFGAAEDAEGLPAQWTLSEIPLGLRGRSAIVAGLGDEAVVIAEHEAGVECLALRRQGAIRFALLEERAMPRLVVSHKDRLWLFSDGEDNTIDATVLSRDGVVIAEGPLGDALRRSGEDGVLFLLLVAWSIVISALVLMMPQNRQIRIVIPPQGYALAEPSRRLFAAIIDLLPGMIVVSLLWSKPLSWWLSPLSEIIAADGSMPLFTLALLTFGYMAVADGVFGRTLGKMTTGCRTMNEDGEKPGLRRGAARSFLKVFCPPLVVVLLLMPYAPAPWSFGTVVVKRTNVEAPEED